MNRYEFYTNLQDWNSKELYHHGVIGQKWGVRRYQNEDGSLTEEGKQRYLNPDGTINNKGRRELSSSDQLKITQAHYREQSEKGIGEYADNAIYDENRQKEKLNEAKSQKMYDLSFVETIQNAENLSDGDLQREYAAYLKNPRKYMEEFSVDSQGNIKNSRSGVHTETPKKEPKSETKPEPKSEPKKVSDYERELNRRLDEKGYVDANDIKELNKYSTEVDSDKKETKSEPKKDRKSFTKEEKKEIKAAQREVQKNLNGGIVSNWALLNKAMKEAGITDQKNLTASDWNRINEKIQELRGSKKSK